MIKWKDAMKWLEENEWDELWEKVLYPHATQGDHGTSVEDVICDLDNNETLQEEIVELYNEFKRND